ncbi:MAG: hypothetical protein HC881_12735 [Leptolyngbyaceae cyanobacterium SL_7_1]|nr:hypothetical protein [Leptolyngbyaceae cyanobacterium SL_7_1]
MPLVEQYLRAVELLSPADRAIAEEWATWMKTQWAEQGKSTMTQQRSLVYNRSKFPKARSISVEFKPLNLRSISAVRPQKAVLHNSNPFTANVSPSIDAVK